MAEMSANITINAMADALRPSVGLPCDPLDRCPWSRRASLEFIRRHTDELEMMLGVRVQVTGSSYTPSGRGAFGRDKGGARAKRSAASVILGTTQ